MGYHAKTYSVFKSNRITMKKTLFILCCILFSSCSKKLYYAYENTAEGSYCTFEVTKKDITYRAVSTEHYVTNSHPAKEYVYINSNNSIPYTKEPRIGYGAILVYLKSQQLPIVMDTNKKYPGFLNRYLFYSTEKNNNSLELVKDEDLMKKEEFFKKHDLFWFPPYLKKVNKIEYEKFNLPYKKKFLQTMNTKYR